MNSRLYRCRVAHKRDKPKQHRFAYTTFVFCLDLDELSEVEKKLTLFSQNRRNLYSLQDRDHLDQGQPSVKENLVSYLRTQGVAEEIGRIELVTNLRTWGYTFNPVSFYFVHRPDGTLLNCVAEVANTFNEQKLYLVDQQSAKAGRLKQSHDKLFYISPFSLLDTKLNFDLQAPEERIKLSITESDADGTFFYSSLSGKSIPLTNGALFKYTLRFPLMTLTVMYRIHWQALRLALKNVPHFKKANRPDLQTDTRVYIKPKHNRSV